MFTYLQYSHQDIRLFFCPFFLYSCFGGFQGNMFCAKCIRGQNEHFKPSVLFQNASLMLQSVSDLSIISNNLQDWLHTVKNILTHPCCTHHLFCYWEQWVCACSHHPKNKIKDTTGGHYTVHAHIIQRTKSKTQQVAVTLSVALGDISCSQSC